MNSWLIRTTKNKLLGPYTAVQVKELIGQRQVGPDDELCQANSYWISLREKQEVARVLGIELSSWPNWDSENDEEPTETGTTDTITKQLDTGGDHERLVWDSTEFKKPYPMERAPYGLSTRLFLFLSGVVLVLALWRLMGK